MNILVTGASGFIGRRLVEHLSTEDRVWCLSRTTAAHPAGTVPVVASLAEAGWTKTLPSDVDLVVHLAQSSRYREFPAAADDLFRVNVQATFELADWARRSGVRRFLLASTGNVYGHSVDESREADPIDPRTMYAATKACAEHLLRPYAEHYEVVIMRLFGVYGPGQENMLIPRLIERVLPGDEITVARGIGVRLNPIFVDDCVELIRRLGAVALPSRYEIVNVGGREIVDLPAIIRALESITGRRAAVRATNDDPISLVGNVRKLVDLSGYEAFTPLVEGLRRTVGIMKSVNENAP